MSTCAQRPSPSLARMSTYIQALALALAGHLYTGPSPTLAGMYTYTQALALPYPSWHVHLYSDPSPSPILAGMSTCERERERTLGYTEIFPGGGGGGALIEGENP